MKYKTIEIKNSHIMNLLKIGVAAFLIIIIYRQLFVNHDFEVLLEEFSNKKSNQSIWFLVLAFLMVFLNWFFEIKRWKLLVNQYYPIDLKTSTKGILMGITLGIISPQRIGEYVGRMMALPRKKNSLSIKANFFTSLSLNIAILFFGLIAVFYFSTKDLLPIDINNRWLVLSGIISLFALLIFLTQFSKIEKYLPVDWVFEKLKNWGTFSQYQFSGITLWKLLGYSILRYFTFLVQYFLLLKFFGIDLNIDLILSCIAIIYLVQSTLPLPGMLSILARGEIAILVFSAFDVNDIAIFSSTFSLWIINLMTPALIGLGIIWNTRLLKN